jgi:hypothetical protein
MGRINHMTAMWLVINETKIEVENIWFGNSYLNPCTLPSSPLPQSYSCLLLIVCAKNHFPSLKGSWVVHEKNVNENFFDNFIWKLIDKIVNHLGKEMK